MIKTFLSNKTNKNLSPDIEMEIFLEKYEKLISTPSPKKQSLNKSYLIQKIIKTLENTEWKERKDYIFIPHTKMFEGTIIPKLLLRMHKEGSSSCHDYRLINFGVDNSLCILYTHDCFKKFISHVYHFPDIYSEQSIQIINSILNMFPAENICKTIRCFLTWVQNMCFEQQLVLYEYY